MQKLFWLAKSGLGAALLFSVMAPAQTWAKQKGPGAKRQTVATERLEPTSFKVEPQIAYQKAVLRAVGPGGFELQQSFKAGTPIEVDLLGASEALADGRYRYEVFFYSGDGAKKSFSGLFFVENGFTVARESKRAQLADIRTKLAGKRQKASSEASPEGAYVDDYFTIYGPSGYSIFIMGAYTGIPPYYASYWYMFNYFGYFYAFNPDGLPFSLPGVNYLGVGTYIPTAPLHVFGYGGGTLQVERNDGVTPNIRFATSGGGVTQNWLFQNNAASGTFAIRDETAGASPLRIFPGNPASTLVLNGGNVGMGTPSPAGTLDVNGSIFQRGGLLHADFVFEPDYELESIEEHASTMWENKHLPAIPQATVDEEGQQVIEIGAHRRGIVEELEKAHIYIEQLNQALKEKEARVAELERKVEEQNVHIIERLKEVESATGVSRQR